MRPTPVELIDGGLSSALSEMGCDLDHPLWTARLLLDDPETLVAAHLAYLRAGARVLISASYQASRRGFAALGLDAAAADAALVRTTELAREAVRRAAAEGLDAHGVRVAASVGPYGAVLADGSEYTGAYPIDHAALVRFHAERLAVLVASGPDLLACETFPGAFEARAVAEALAGGPEVPAWVTFTCRSDRATANGDAVEAAVEAALGVPGLVAVGVNCTAPEHVGELLRRIARVTYLPLVAYPNSGQRWDAAHKRWLGDASVIGDAVDGWVASGARLVGGCCGVGPADIAALGRRLA